MATHHAYLPRTLEASIIRASQRFPVLMLSGPRQVGKKTLLKTLWRELPEIEPPYPSVNNNAIVRLYLVTSV